MTPAEKEIRSALDAGPTPGEWKGVATVHFDTGLTYVSVQPEPADPDRDKLLAMANGEHHICRMSHSAAAHRISLYKANARFIAACNPANMASVLSELTSLREERDRLREALKPFAAYETADGLPGGVLRIPDEHPTLFNGLGDNVKVIATVGDFRRARALQETQK